MKKIILFILVGLFSSTLLAQRYKITYTASAEAEPCDPDPIRNSYDRILIENTDENKSFVLALAHCDALIDNKVNAVGYINFLPNAISEKRYAETSSGTVVIDDFQRNPISFNHCDTKSTTLFFKTVTVTIEPFTEINPKPPGNPCLINLYVDQSGFASEVYVWQYYDIYKTTTDKWTNLPAQFQGLHSITFQPRDIFGGQTSNYLNKTINFRMQRYCQGKYTNVQPYVMISCSPQLQGPPIPQKTSCNYKNDGSFTLNFDRDLNSGERLAITLFIQNAISGAFDVIPAGGQVLNISALNNKSYTWPSNLPAGNYKLKYQSHTGGLSGNDPSWTGNSLEPVDLTIGNAAPVDFSVFGSADENCFEVKDGYIDLRATREGSRQLFYQYSIDGGAYSSWFPFSSGNETRINGLGKGEYKIKVKDSEGCLAK